jgi:hypothetical protein
VDARRSLARRPTFVALDELGDRSFLCGDCLNDLRKLNQGRSTADVRLDIEVLYADCDECLSEWIAEAENQPVLAVVNGPQPSR